MDKLHIVTKYKVEDLKEYKALFKQIIKVCKNKLSISHDLELSLTVCNSEYIRKLNKDYRGIDKVTDVLSFAIEDDMSEQEKQLCLSLEGIREIGDIIINYDRVISQAIDYGHSNKREFCFLFTHGLLHLLGYDHMNESDEKIMFSLQEEILNELKIVRSE